MKKRRIYETSMSHLPNDDIHFIENVIIRLFDNIYDDLVFLEDCYIPGIGTIDYISINDNQLEVVDRNGHYIMLSDLRNKDWDILFYAVKDAILREFPMNKTKFLEMVDEIYNEEKEKSLNNEYSIMENKKILYEKIMRNVSKEVKRALSESSWSKMFSKGTNFVEKAIAKLITGEGISDIYLDNFKSSAGTIDYINVIDGELELCDPTGDYILANALTEDDWDNLFYAVRDALYDNNFI